MLDLNIFKVKSNIAALLEDPVFYLMNNQIVCCFEMVVIYPTLNKENQMKEYSFDVLLGGTNSLL